MPVLGKLQNGGPELIKPLARHGAHAYGTDTSLLIPHNTGRGQSPVDLVIDKDRRDRVGINLGKHLIHGVNLILADFA